ncbi:MAG TPA: acyltransferase [Phenylobacterium sp.]|nr:acyltransferase [Phenylobacterium sp.]HQN51111.1 acyltransferase [Phenylobacterium sp.]
MVLDGLRFLAAGLIVLYHYQSEGPWPLDRLSPVFLRGYLATDFFLILSGYVLGRAYGRKIAGGTVSDERFLLLRVMRVWPAHLVMLAAFAVVIALGVALGAPPAHPDQYQLSDLPSQALLIHAWGLHTGSGWNLPTWSLSALVICYAAFPTLWRKLNRVGASLLLFIGGLAAVWAADLVSRTLYHHALFDLPFNLGVLRALPLFVFGACIARAGELDWPPSRWAVWLAVASGLLVTVLQGFGRFDLMSVALLGLLVGAGGAVRTSRGQQVAAKAGQISFALYITHIFVAMIWFHATRMIVARFAPPEWLQWVMWGLALPAAIATAIAFERLVDQPLQKAVGRLISWRPARYRELARSE